MQEGCDRVRGRVAKIKAGCVGSSLFGEERVKGDVKVLLLVRWSVERKARWRFLTLSFVWIACHRVPGTRAC